MAKYLDLEGLTSYDGKIKEYVVPKTRKVNNKELSADISLGAGDVGAEALGTSTGVVASHNIDSSAHGNRFINFVPKSNANVPGGFAKLDDNAKIGLAQIPDAVLGQVEYLGQWNASTGAASGSDLRSPAGRAYRKGDYFVCSVAGNKVPKADGTEGSVSGTINYAVGDWLIYTTEWEKVDNTDAVTSVCGRTGAITLTKNDVGLDKVQNLDIDSVPTASSYNYVYSAGVAAALSYKQDVLMFDDTPTAGSNNPVKSGGIKTELDKKANTADIPTTLAELAEDTTHRVVTDTEKSTWNGKQAKLTFDTTPTAGSSNPVTSGGVKTALNAKQDTMTAITTAEINALFA